MSLFPIDFTAAKKSEILAVADSIVAAMEFENTLQEADFFRHFVHGNSRHVPGKDRITDPHLLLKKCMFHFYRGGPAPNATCGPKTLALSLLLAHRNIEFRLRHTYSSKFPEVRGHTFLEIYHESTNTWSIEDPDYDIAFLLKEDLATRLSAEEMVQLDISEAVPLSWEAIETGWQSDPFYTSNQLYHFYEAVLMPESKTLLVNSRKFDLAKIFSNGKTFIQMMRETYPGIKVILSPL